MSDLSDPRYPQQQQPVRYDLPPPDTFDHAVTEARRALRGEAQWSGYLTAPAVIAAAVGAELRELREIIDQLTGAADDS